MGRAAHGHAHRPGAHAPARDRYAALALTILVNAVAGVLLLRVATQAPASGGGSEAVMTVVWVERARPAPIRPAPVARMRARERPAAAAVAAERDAGLSVAAPVVGPDLRLDSTPLQEPDRDGTQSGAFRHRGVFGPRAADPFAKTGDGIFRMRDASVGGRLQAMARRSICRELRAQLHSGGNADMEAVLRTMAEQGCS